MDNNLVISDLGIIPDCGTLFVKSIERERSAGGVLLPTRNKGMHEYEVIEVSPYPQFFNTGTPIPQRFAKGDIVISIYSFAPLDPSINANGQMSGYGFLSEKQVLGKRVKTPEELKAKES
jgi:hypothetical protein